MVFQELLLIKLIRCLDLHILSVDHRIRTVLLQKDRGISPFDRDFSCGITQDGASEHVRKEALLTEKLHVIGHPYMVSEILQADTIQQDLRFLLLRAEHGILSELFHALTISFIFIDTLLRRVHLQKNHDPDGTHAGRCQIQCRRGPESAGSDDENLCVKELLLALCAHLF